MSFSLLPAGAALGQEPQEQPQGRVDLQADDATGASIAFSQATFESADEALLGRDDLFADNLASGALQQEERPLLLTDSDDLEDDVLEELERLGVTTVHILGGTEAISEDVADELEDEGYTVNRFAGETRIETSIEITDSLDTDTAIVARSEGEGTQAFADSLAAGGFAADQGYGLLLNPTTFVAETIAEFLETGEIDNLIIVGGTAAISQQVQEELEELVDGDVTRVSGANRFETAVEIAQERGHDDAGDADGVILVEGDEDEAWASGFSAAAHSAIFDFPIVLADNDALPPATEDYLEGADADGTTALVCGPFLDDACEAAAEILGAPQPPGNQSFTLTPAAEAVRQVGAVRSFTASGIDADAVDIVLFGCQEVVTTSDGVVAFQDSDADRRADLGTTAAAITSVNGVPGSDGNQVTVTGGQVTFGISSSAQTCTVPVVFADGDGDDRLDLDAGDQPAEDFGVGGATTFVPSEAASGSFQVTVSFVDARHDYFVGDGVTYFYDSEDRFSVDGSTGTLAAFEAALGTGDTVAGDYRRDAGTASTFNLSNAVTTAPEASDTIAPTSAAATVSTDGGLSDTADAGDVYKVVFSEAMAVPASGATLRVRDADGTVADVIAGAAATLRLNTELETVEGHSHPAGTVLTATLATAPSIVTAGTSADLQYPADIINSAGITDTARNRYDLNGSTDVRLEVAGVVDAPAQTATAVSAEFTNWDGADNGMFGTRVGDVLTVTYDETVKTESMVDVTINVDINGPNADGGIFRIDCDGTNVVCTLADNGGIGNQLVVTVQNEAAEDVSFEGLQEVVIGSTGVTDTDGNEPDGYPVAID